LPNPILHNTFIRAGAIIILSGSALYPCNFQFCSQLFGEADADEEVSPDTEDPEAVGEAGEKAVQNKEKEGVAGGIERASTRAWAEEIGYNPLRLFNKVST